MSTYHTAVGGCASSSSLDIYDSCLSTSFQSGSATLLFMSSSWRSAPESRITVVRYELWAQNGTYLNTCDTSMVQSKHRADKTTSSMVVNRGQSHNFPLPPYYYRHYYPVCLVWIVLLLIVLRRRVLFLQVTTWHKHCAKIEPRMFSLP